MQFPFDTKRFLKDHFGSPTKVQGLLQAYGLSKPTEVAIAKWFQRGRVPGNYLALLICVAELEAGASIRIAQYLKPACLKRSEVP